MHSRTKNAQLWSFHGFFGGTVNTNPDSEFLLGADEGTACCAELYPQLWAALYALNMGKQDSRPITVCYDCKAAAGVTGAFISTRTHTLLADLSMS